VRTPAIGAIVSALLLTGCGQVITLELPSTGSLQDAAPRVPPVQSVIYDVHGEPLTILRDEYREPVGLGDLPPHLLNAVITAEDRRFHQHRGIDGRSLIRAALSNLATGEIGQGGSTITQQLVKNLYMPDAPRTPETKLQEAVLARGLEEQRSKGAILEDYLNTVYFGEGAYGIEAAAQTYFRKPASDLEVAESALLAAIIRAPEALAPTRNPDAALLRRDDVLWRMAVDGHLSPVERDAATATAIEVHGRFSTPQTREPHLVDLVVRELLNDPRFGSTEQERARRLYGGGLHIHTTVQPELQEIARAVLAQQLPDPDDPDAGITIIDPSSGHILAAVSSRPYTELQFDLATQGRRQPGSTFKTFVLATAIADGWRPDAPLDGRQGDIELPGGGVWEDVRNYDRRSYTRVSLAAATRASVNTAFARLGVDVGLERVAGLAGAMGVRSSVPVEVQTTIGGGELSVTTLDMAAGMATLANLGEHVPTTAVSRIDDADGRVVWLPDTVGRQVLDPSAAFVTLEVLRGVVEQGTAVRARVDGWEVAGKTGTTSDHTDAWFVGATPSLSGAVWVGHADGRIPMHDVHGIRNVTGGTIPAQIFSEVFTRFLAETQPVPFRLPDAHTVLVDIDPVTGLLAAPWCAGQVERLPRVLVPTETCPEPPPPPPPPPPPVPAEPEPGEADTDVDAADDAEEDLTSGDDDRSDGTDDPADDPTTPPDEATDIDGGAERDQPTGDPVPDQPAGSPPPTEPEADNEPGDDGTG